MTFLSCLIITLLTLKLLDHADRILMCCYACFPVCFIITLWMLNILAHIWTVFWGFTIFPFLVVSQSHSGHPNLYPCKQISDVLHRRSQNNSVSCRIFLFTVCKYDSSDKILVSSIQWLLQHEIFFLAQDPSHTKKQDQSPKMAPIYNWKRGQNKNEKVQL